MTHKLSWALGAILLLGALSRTAAAPPAASALNKCDVSDASVDGEEQGFLQLINAYRASNGLGALALDPNLTRSAAWMANDLASHSAFGHTDSLGRSPWVRMPDCGVSWPGGENLAAGTNYSGAQTALNAWINSGAHREVMLTGDFKSIGIARVFAAGSQYGWYWVTDFGYVAGDSNPVATTTPAPTQVPALAPPKNVAVAPAAAPAAPPPPVQKTLPLGNGLSLITWNGGYVSPESVFGPAASWVSMVYVFDLGSEQWLRWGPALDPTMETLTEMRIGVQYWVIATRAVEVVVD
ncbi:MAG: CAP domain-containing protein [bacterium]